MTHRSGTSRPSPAAAQCIDDNGVIYLDWGTERQPALVCVTDASDAVAIGGPHVYAFDAWSGSAVCYNVTARAWSAGDCWRYFTKLDIRVDRDSVTRLRRNPRARRFGIEPCDNDDDPRTWDVVDAKFGRRVVEQCLRTRRAAIARARRWEEDADAGNLLDWLAEVG
jgi:hypothetical protein